MTLSPAGATSRPVISLTTDFGVGDSYVAAMKGVLLSRLPAAQLVDVSHAVAPQDVFDAAFVVATAWPYFPAGSVHLVVVDPGVGTARRRLALQTNGHSFVGPDNGCLSAALTDSVRGARAPGADYDPRLVSLPEDVVAVSIEAEALLGGPSSATFEGRDVFAPAAAYLAGGGDVAALGPRLDAILAYPAFRAPATDDGVEGLILHVDHFGNLISDIVAADLAPDVLLRVAGHALRVERTYGDAAGICAIAGSGGLIEIALPGGNAAVALGVGVGDRIVATAAGAG